MKLLTVVVLLIVIFEYCCTKKFYVSDYGNVKETSGDKGTVNNPVTEVTDPIIEKELQKKADNESIEILIWGQSDPKKKIKKYRIHSFTTSRNVTIKQWSRIRPVHITFSDYLITAEDGVNKDTQVIKLIGLTGYGPLIHLKRKNNVRIYIAKCNIISKKSVLVKSNTENSNVYLDINHLVCSDCFGIAYFKSLATSSVLNINGSTIATSSNKVKRTEKYGAFQIERIVGRIVVNIKYTMFDSLQSPFQILSDNKVCKDKKVDLSRLTIKFSNFTSNGSPVHIKGCFSVNIQNSMFTNNLGTALHLEQSNRTFINNVKFLNNMGALQLDHVAALINGTQFHNNFISEHGGAITARDSQVIVIYSSFINNAKQSGVTIHHQKVQPSDCKPALCRLKLTDVIIQESSNSLSKKNLIYSDDLIILKRLLVDTNLLLEQYLTSEITTDIIKSEIGVIGSFNLTCPNQYVPKTKMGEKKVKLPNGNGTGYYPFEEISCKMCPDKTYNYKPTTLVNPPTDTKSSTINQCLRCPDGGNCSLNIISQDNYWGFSTPKNELHFLRCPDSYCCSKDTIQCNSFETCGYKRTGMLCGACSSKYTVDFFSNSCISNGSCHPWLFWIFQFFGMLLTVYFFMYDVYLVPLKKLINKLRKKAPTVPISLSVQSTNTSGQGSRTTGDVLERDISTSNPAVSVNAEEVDGTTTTTTMQELPVEQETGLVDITDQVIDGNLDILLNQNNAEERNRAPSDIDLKPSTNGNRMHNEFTASEEELFNVAEILTRKNLSTENQHIEDNPANACDDHITFDPFSMDNDFSSRKTDEKEPTSPARSKSPSDGDEKEPTSPARSKSLSDGDVSILDVTPDNPHETLSKDELAVVNFSNGIVKILFYFYQFGDILRLTKDHGFVAWLTGMFKFQFKFLYSKLLCPMSTIDRLTKDWIETVNIILLFLIPALVNVSIDFIKYMKNRNRESSKLQRRLKRSAIDLLMLTYPLIASKCFSMVTCVNINGASRFYFQADAQCYSPIQVFTILFIIGWVFPLPLAIFGAGKLLQNDRIRLHHFYHVLFCPSYCLYLWFIARKRKWKALGDEIPAGERKEQDKDIAHVLHGFYGPFRTSRGEETNDKKRMNWQAVILGRGLLLSMFIPLTPTNGARLVISLILIISFGIHQFKCKPYNTKILNRSAMAALSALVCINITSLLQAFSYSYFLNEKSPLKPLETALAVWLQSFLSAAPAAVTMLALGASAFQMTKEKLYEYITKLSQGKKYGPPMRERCNDIVA